MSERYSISLIAQFRTLRESVYFSLLILIGILVAAIFGVHLTWDNLASFIVPAVIISIFWLPALFLHVDYLLENRSMELVINKHSNQIIIKTRKKTSTYGFGDIIHAEQHIGIYWKNKLDQRGRRFVPWTKYGYLKIRFSDGAIFNFTSIMIDVLDPPFTSSYVFYHLFPLVSNKEVSAQ
ncbi:MAG: hypothetical protein INR69_12655 [Mucilaginibacter polytrichastri]|nr:hypothetical protein [Mucilaginibacter polytrichastri]